MKSGKITHVGNLEIEIGSSCQYQKLLLKESRHNLKKDEKFVILSFLLMKSGQIAHVGNLEIEIGSECQYQNILLR